MSSMATKNRPTVVAPWQWTVPAPSVTRPAAKTTWVRAARQEMWAGFVYLAVWSLLWLAVIVTVLAPLDGFVGGAR